MSNPNGVPEVKKMKIEDYISSDSESEEEEMVQVPRKKLEKLLERIKEFKKLEERAAKIEERLTKGGL